MDMQLDNLDYSTLSARPRLLRALRSDVQDAVVSVAGMNVSRRNVDVTFFPGSVVARATIIEKDPYKAEQLETRLQQAVHKLRAELASRAATLQGLSDAASGSIGVGDVRVRWVDHVAGSPKATAGASRNVFFSWEFFVVLVFCCVLAAGSTLRKGGVPNQVGTGAARGVATPTRDVHSSFQRNDAWYKPVYVMDAMPSIPKPAGPTGSWKSAMSSGLLPQSSGFLPRENSANRYLLHAPEVSYAPWIQGEPATQAVISAMPSSPGSRAVAQAVQSGLPPSPGSATSSLHMVPGQQYSQHQQPLDLMNLPGSPAPMVPDYLQPRIVVPERASSWDLAHQYSSHIGSVQHVQQAAPTTPRSMVVPVPASSSAVVGTVVAQMLQDGTGGTAGGCAEPMASGGGGGRPMLDVVHRMMEYPQHTAQYTQNQLGWR